MTETEKKISAALFAFVRDDEYGADIYGCVIDNGATDAGATATLSGLCDRIAIWIADGGAVRALALPFDDDEPPEQIGSASVHD